MYDTPFGRKYPPEVLVQDIQRYDELVLEMRKQPIGVQIFPKDTRVFGRHLVNQINYSSLRGLEHKYLIILNALFCKRVVLPDGIVWEDDGKQYFASSIVWIIAMAKSGWMVPRHAEMWYDLVPVDYVISQYHYHDGFGARHIFRVTTTSTISVVIKKIAEMPVNNKYEILSMTREMSDTIAAIERQTYLEPEESGACLVNEKNNAFFLIKEREDKMWNFPGGKTEIKKVNHISPVPPILTVKTKKETATETLVRELKEETGNERIPEVTPIFSDYFYSPSTEVTAYVFHQTHCPIEERPAAARYFTFDEISKGVVPG